MNTRKLLSKFGILVVVTLFACVRAEDVEKEQKEKLNEPEDNFESGNCSSITIYNYKS